MNSPACVAALREDAGLGPRTLWRLLDRFGSAEAVLAASFDDLRETPGIGPDRAQRVVLAAERLPAVHARLASVSRRGIALVTAFDAAYPARLRRLPDGPLFLYARGDLPPEDRPCIAVVGAHQASAAGIASATRWAGSLARRGVVIVSGLAAGIDAAGHQGALEAGGLTLAVVGLSDLVLIVEARINAAGTMDAAHRALKACIPVCAVRTPLFPANERLISQGAQPVPVDPDPDALLALLS